MKKVKFLSAMLIVASMSIFGFTPSKVETWSGTASVRVSAKEPSGSSNIFCKTQWENAGKPTGERVINVEYSSPFSESACKERLKAAIDSEVKCWETTVSSIKYSVSKD